jgi:hypothetical protein
MNIPSRIQCKCKDNNLQKLKKQNPNLAIFINDNKMAVESYDEKSGEITYYCPHCNTTKILKSLP